VGELVDLLKPFDDVTNYISGSTYPTMSVIFPTMETLKQTFLSKASDESSRQEEPRSALDVSLGVDLIDDSDMFGGDADYEDEPDETLAKEPTQTKGLVTAVRTELTRLFRTHYNVSY
jgi:hypothetical protein